jgi:diaminopimelate epimerase
MISIAKAHAYGNDFLFIPHAQAEGLDPVALARATCARHTGVAGRNRADDAL